MFTTALLSLAFAAAPALAHFHLNYPPPRGPFVAQMELSFCSDYPTGARSPFPLDSGFVDITSEHPSAIVGFYISFDADPTTFVQFNTTDNGTSYPMLKPFFSMNWEGELCLPVDAESVGLPIVNGTNATIQVQFNGGDGNLFDCADVVLITNYTVPSTASCSNSTAATSGSSASPITSIPTATPPAAATGSPTASSSSAALALQPASVGLLAVVGAALALTI
ncbi:hypothetical protein CALCODRAFT_153824 [Calocera cornea HHB12733]|uniref:Copper acquisition factor BIM1-like domain-containing protein n=1 Tax=Calocera cornea HHB12733 TaxID=1353952 RepID=A0A165CMT1_9BASI|nr:hypothetical protein CALCODRAFT_153824 [Calocera cornea HHB12733]